MSNRDLHEEKVFALALTSATALMALQESSPLQLRYTFTSSPNPVRASASGTNPNVVSVQVMISNPRTRPVSMASISIAIPVGENSARALSSITALPDPVYDTTGEWSISSSGGIVLIEPADGSTGEMTDSILFSIEGIPINQEPGVAPITVTEIAQAGQRVADSVTYSLTKLASDFPVVNFWADPPVLDDLAAGSRLYWTCSEDGKRYSYGIASEGWLPRDCLNAGTCFSCAEGAAGVDTPELNATTTFTLSVIGTDAAGGRVARATLTTTVRVEVPGISQNSHATQIGRSGRLVEMHWLASNAVHCSVLLDGAEIAAGAPANTYKNGYVVMVMAEPGRHQLTLVAHGASGAQATFLFPDITIQASASIGLAGNAASLAATPDGRRAFVTSFDGEWHMGAIFGGHGSYVRSNPYMEVIDLTTMTLERTIPIGTPPGRVAITTDGRFAAATCDAFGAMFFGGNQNVVTVIDTSSLAAGTKEITGGMALSVTSARHGALVLVSTVSENGSALTLQDLSGQAAAGPPIQLSQYATAVAVRGDGKSGVAVVSEPAGSTLASGAILLDIEGHAALPGTIPLPADFFDIAITPDGALALVVGTNEELTIIDIASRAAEPVTLHIGRSGIEEMLQTLVGLSRSIIAISSDGKLAYVLRENGARLVVVHIPGRHVVGGMPVPASSSVALSPDGRMVLLAGGKSVTVL